MANWWDNDPVANQPAPRSAPRPLPTFRAPRAPEEVVKDELSIRSTEQGLQNDATRIGLSQRGAAIDEAKFGIDQQDRPFKRGDTLRGDFDKRQEVKDYRTSVPLLLSALKTKRDPQGDNALVYAYAKIMDPNSVVRESESATAAATAGAVEAAVEKWKKNLGFDDAVGLPRGASANLLREMNTKVAQFAKAYGVVRRDFQELAKRQDVNPEDVVGRSPAEGFVDEYKRLANRQGWTDREDPPAIDIRPTEIDPTGANPLLSPEDRNFLAANARSLGPQGVRDYVAARGLTIPEDEIQKAFEYYSQGGQQDPVVNAPQGAGNIIGEALATPLGTAATSYLNAASAGVPQLIAGDRPFDALAARNPKSAIAGDIAGGVTGTLLGGAGLAKAGLSIPRAGLASNLGYGAAFGANTTEENRLAGGAVGAGAALLGEGAGRYVVAPALDAAVRSRAGQAVTSALGSVVPRRLNRAEVALGAELGENEAAIRQSLDDATRLGLPMSLADASTAGRSTLGAATRLDPAMAETAAKELVDRGLGRNDRALEALTRLSEPVDMRATSSEIFRAAQEAATPFYERAYANPAISTPELSNLLSRPSTTSAMGRARNIIAEEGGSPDTIGFALDAANNPILNPLPTGQMAELGAANAALSEARDALARGNASLAGVDRNVLQQAVTEAEGRVAAAQAAVDAAPTAGMLAETPAFDWRALDYTKRGLDDVLEELRDPITRQLPNDYKTRSIQNTRVAYRNALGSLNDDYRQGLEAYSQIARRNDDLNAGFSAANSGINLNDFNRMVSSLDEEGLDYFRRGFVTNLSDNIKAKRDSVNGYDIIGGSKNQREKLKILFPDAEDFLRQRELERAMTATQTEVVGGSPTAGRMAANERLVEPDAATVAELGVSAVTGTPPIGVMARGAQNAVRGVLGGRSRARTLENARSVAPALSAQSPIDAARYLGELGGDISALRGYNDRLRYGASALAAPTVAALLGPYRR